jgi:hypothetical protein
MTQAGHRDSRQGMYEGASLLLSAKGVDLDRADDYTCDWCDKTATGYLFLGHQFCDDHNPIAEQQQRDGTSLPLPLRQASRIETRLLS